MVTAVNGGRPRLDTGPLLVRVEQATTRALAELRERGEAEWVRHALLDVWTQLEAGNVASARLATLFARTLLEEPAGPAAGRSHGLSDLRSLLTELESALAQEPVGGCDGESAA